MMVTRRVRPLALERPASLIALHWELGLTSHVFVDRVIPPDATPPTSSPTSEMEPPDTPRTAKSVIFIPLSPKSSATLRRHHESQATKSETEDVVSDSDDNRKRGKKPADGEPDKPRRRRNSDTSSDRPSASSRRSRDKEATSETDDEDAIEMLPDRFDAQGRPLDGSGSSRGGGSEWHSRRGDFEYRSPRGANGTQMRGEWGVAGADAEAVERIMRDVTGVLEGRGSWMGLIGGILSGSLLKGPGGGGDDEDDDGKGRGKSPDRSLDRDRSRDRDRDRSRDGRDEDKRRRKRDDDRDEDRRRRRRDDDDGNGESSSRRRREDDERGESSSRRRRGEDERGESSRHAEDRRTRGRERDGYDDDDDDEHYYEDRKRRSRGGRDDRCGRGVGRSQTWG